MVVLAACDFAAEAAVLLASNDSSVVLVANSWGLCFSPGRVFIESCAERGDFERGNLQLLETLNGDSLGTSAQDFH